MNVILAAKVTHDRVRGIKQLSQVREKPILSERKSNFQDFLLKTALKKNLIVDK